MIGSAASPRKPTTPASITSAQKVTMQNASSEDELYHYRVGDGHATASDAAGRRSGRNRVPAKRCGCS